MYLHKNTLASLGLHSDELPTTNNNRVYEKSCILPGPTKILLTTEHKSQAEFIIDFIQTKEIPSNK
jgi:hypothetical protein